MTKAPQNIRIFGILGYPVRHALSPLMHSTAFKELGLPYEYHLLEVAPESLRVKLNDFIDAGYSGFNVTLPHKTTILKLLHNVESTAQAIGAVNTILVHDGRMEGYNTDVLGFIESVKAYQSYFHKKKILILGAGGAARAVVFGIVKEFAPDEVIVVARNLEKANSLIASFGSNSSSISPEGTRFRAIGWNDASFREELFRASVIVNATPVGMKPNVNQSPIPEHTTLHSGQLAVDLIYTPLETRFLKLAAEAGARTIGGLEMLVYQGSHAFQLFTGLSMPLDKVRQMLETKLS